MMEDTWLSVEDESNSSFVDSDAIDSETEADLYSIIHYEQNIHNLKCPTAKIEKVHTSDETKNLSLTEDSTEFNESRLVNTFNHETVFLNKESQKLNLVKKYKSDSSDKCNVSYSQNSEDVNQTGKDTSSNKKKRKSDCDSSVSSNSVKKSFTGLNDSSDSDSVMWTEVDASDGKEFQTNLCEDDVISLSSDSETHFDGLRMSKKSEGNLRNMSMPNIKIGENTKDLLWFVNEQDLRRSRHSRSRRYHDNVEDTCSNCLGKGHNYKICPLPKTIKCFICGGVGHPAATCAKRMCGRCFNAGHDSKRCWRPSGNCILCSMKGHVKENCPDLWRRYHLTTRPGEIVRGQKPTFSPGSLPYCWNCGQDGHLGSVCRESRAPKYRLCTWPCVISYTDPETLLKERFNSNRDRHNNSRRENRLNQTKKARGASMLVFNTEENNNEDRRNNFRRENHLNQMNTSAGANVSPKKRKKKSGASILVFNSEEKNNGERCNNSRSDNHLNQMNTALGVNTSPEKKKENNMRQHWKQWKQFKKAQREKDFPRTPNNNQSNCFDDPVPESLKKMLIKKQKQKEKNRKRRLKRRSQLLAKRNGSKNSLQTGV